MGNEESNRRLIEAADKRRAQILARQAGELEPGADLTRARVGKLPTPEQLPPPERTFAYPLKSEQLAKLQRGDAITSFPLPIIIRALRDQTTLYDSFTEGKAVSEMAKGLMCDLRVESFTSPSSDEVRVRVQTQLPSTNQLNAKEAWKITAAVVELPINTLRGNWRNRIVEMFGKD